MTDKRKGPEAGWNEQDSIDFLGKKVVGLSLVELGLGSLIHAFKVPLGGNFLSLYQIFYLTRASMEARSFGLEKRSPYLISSVSAVLKSLAPAGARLGPMLSIGMQGVLYSLGCFVFGASVVGYVTGAVLAGFWAFLQPFLTYFLFFGTDLVRAIHYFINKVFPFHVHWILDLVIVVIALKAALSVLSVVLAYRFDQSRSIRGFERKMIRVGRRLMRQKQVGLGERPRRSAVWEAGRDLCKPLFLISLALSCAFVYYTENDATRIWIYALRPLSIAFLFFYLSRSAFLIRLLAKLDGSGWVKRSWAAGSLRGALEELRRLSASAV